MYKLKFISAAIQRPEIRILRGKTTRRRKGGHTFAPASICHANESSLTLARSLTRGSKCRGIKVRGTVSLPCSGACPLRRWLVAIGFGTTASKRRYR
jgi:hypothetical protein